MMQDISLHPPLARVRHRAARRQRHHDRRRRRLLLFQWHWMLGTIFLVCSLPLWYVGYRFEKRYGALARQSQDQAGDLATSVEESVHGIRVLKAFGRGKHALQKFTQQAETLRETEIEQGRRGRLGSGSGSCCCPTSPSRSASAAGIVLTAARPAHRRRARRVLRDGDGAALADGVDRLPVLVPPRRAHGDRPHLRGLRQREHDRRSREPRSRSPSRAARSRSRACTSAIQDAPAPSATCSTASTSCSSPARRWRSSASPARARRRSPRCPTRLYDVTGGRVTLDGVDVRDLTLAELRTHVAMAFEDATLFSAVGARQRAARPRRPRARQRRGRGRAARGARHRPGRLRRRPARRRRHDDRRGGPEPLGRPASAPRARARRRGEARRARARRPAVGARRRHRGARRGGAAPGARRRRPRSSSRTVRRRWRSPTGSRCSRTAASPRSAPTPSCCATSEHYRYVISSLEIAACRDEQRRRT